MEPLRLGFIGAGVMASHTTYPSLHFAPIQLRAVCDVDEARARAAAEKFANGRWYTDFRTMWDKEDLEAVIVQMHPSPRQPIVLEALRAGLHVFVPKPPAFSLTEAQELSEVSRQTGRTLMVNFQRRFSFGVSRARQIMSDPAFGKLTQLCCSFCSGAYDEIRGGGYDTPVQAYVLDFALHHLDLARYLGGEVAQMSLFHNQLEGRISIAVALRFAQGAVGTLQLNSQRIWWRNYDRIEITGQGEYLVVDGLWSVKHYTEARNTFTENYSDQRSGELTGDAPSLIEFVEAIREAREPISSIRDAVETMRLYQAVYDALLEGSEGVIPI